jgi:hypothetical protein
MLIPIALIVLLLAMATGRWLVKRSLGLLTVEQKARAMDASSTGNIWPLPCLAVGVALSIWVLPGRIPPPYRIGFLAAFIFTLVLVSAGAAATSVVRLSRAGLPQNFIRSVALRAILFFTALLVLIAVLSYAVSGYARSQARGAQSSNHAIQRTATRYAITFPMIKTLPLRLALAPGSRR